MSLRSMTGYGRGEHARGGTRVVFELSSVNRKQLDIVLQLPRGFASLEERILAAMHEKVSRGRIKVEAQVIQGRTAGQSSVVIDEDLAASYLKELRSTAKRLSLPDNLTAQDLLSLPQVVRYEEQGIDPDATWEIAEKALNKALRQFIQTKNEEGAALERDLIQRFAKLETYVKRIRKRAPMVVRTYRKTLFKRLEEAGVGTALDDERLVKEIALFADRSDISEELTRLGSHLDQALRKCRQAPPVGKNLDFLAQEMFREINTTGSKANDAKILTDVVEFKAELERIREQVQNIE